jgi:large subunit ribosomal protein L35
MQPKGCREGSWDGRLAAERVSPESAQEPGVTVVFRSRVCHNAALPSPGRKGCRGDGEVQNQHAQTSRIRPAGHLSMAVAAKESQMPKLKTKSGAKKRFKVTAGGKVLYQQSHKRHGMIKRTKKQIRQLRGTSVLFKTDGDKIKKYYLPNA